MIIVVPVVNQKELTKNFVKNLEETVNDRKHFQIIIVDNASDPIYTPQDFIHTATVTDISDGNPLKPEPLHLTVMRNNFNVGMFYAVKQVYDAYHELYPNELIGVIHNDVIFYEKGWDVKVDIEFMNDPKLGLLGFVGSDEANNLGGRGLGTMSNFAGLKGATAEQTGKRIVDFRPSVLLDSLTMIFRQSVIPELKIDEHIVPYHFYDKIWSIRTIEAGYHVGTLGVSIDHIGGVTAEKESTIEESFRKWLEKEGITLLEGESPSNKIYQIAEQRWLGEYRDQKHFIPCRVDNQFNIIHG